MPVDENGRSGCDDSKPPCCDVDCDIMQAIWQQEMELDQALTGETSSHIEINSTLWRQTQAMKAKEVDPIEAATTETILNGTRRNA